MGEVAADISASLDGYVAGPDQSEEEPLGRGGEALHEWVFPLAFFEEMHGRSGGETGPDNDVLVETHAKVGVTVMGRGMFGGGPGPWEEEDPWQGWWGDEPPYGHPVFVLTHHEREPLVLGATTFNFVTAGIEAAIGLAREAAHDRDVLVAGGAQAIQQALSAGMVDVLQIHQVPLLLGGGARLMDGLNPAQLGFEIDRVISSPGVTHLRYRVK